MARKLKKKIICKRPPVSLRNKGVITDYNQRLNCDGTKALYCADSTKVLSVVIDVIWACSLIRTLKRKTAIKFLIVK